MTAQPLTIRQVAQRTGVSSKTLRYWEALRLLPKPRRTRLIHYHRKWKRQGACPPMSPNEICCLIEAVPLTNVSTIPERR